MFKYIMSLILISGYLILPNSFGYNNQSGLMDILLSMITHSNIIHLFLNVLSLITICISIENRIGLKYSTYIYLFCIYISIQSSYISNFYTIPTNGFSGVIFAMFGVNVLIDFLNRIKFKYLIIKYLPVIVLIISSSFNDSINNTLHVLSLFSSIVIGYLLFLIYKVIYL